MKKTLLALFLSTILFGCSTNKFENFTKSERYQFYNSLDKIELDNSGSIVSVELKNGGVENVKSFSEDDWGIYKYRIDGLIGRVVKEKTLANGNYIHEILISLKDREKLPKIEELKDGEINSRIIEKEKMGGFSLGKFLGLTITEKYCLQYMEKDIKTLYLEDFDFDLKLAKRYFENQDDDFNIDDYKVINGVVLQQITYKEFTSGDTKIDASDIPVDATVLISGNYAYTSSDTKYTVKYRVVPTYLSAKAIKDRADLEQ
jgi:hypothetical protein